MLRRPPRSKGTTPLDEPRSIDAAALLIQGPIADTILAQAEKLGAGLIVVGSHGHGATYDLLVGSISSGVIRRARVPVLVVPSAGSGGG